MDGAVVRTYAPGSGHVFLENGVPAGAASGDPARPARYCYLRVRQEDGHRAWSSPVWLSAAAPPAG